MGSGFSETGKVTLAFLLPMNDRRNDLDKTRCTQRGANILGSPGNCRISFPLLTTFDAFDAQFALGQPHDTLPSRKIGKIYLYTLPKTKYSYLQHISVRISIRHIVCQEKKEYNIQYF
jgi:hypothetical protein